MRSQVQPFRKTTSVSARLVLGDGTALPCLIENLSAGGAKVLIDFYDSVPDGFRLVADELDLSLEAEVAWRSGTEMGVRFRGKPSVAGPLRSRA